jgi:putative DeoR family transcriptional regulator (stage III sporulation protein D)
MKEEAAFCGPCEMYRQKRSERCEILGEYLIENSSTVRQVAHAFGVSKSTVHKDLTTVLKRINPVLYKKAKNILEQNKQERHLRGGEATKQKYLKNRSAAIKKNKRAGKNRS